MKAWWCTLLMACGCASAARAQEGGPLPLGPPAPLVDPLPQPLPEPLPDPLPEPNNQVDPIIAARADVATACTLPAQWAHCKTTLADNRALLTSVDDAAMVKDLDERLAVWSVAAAKTIGVLLPLSGPQAKAGETAREAIELALSDLGVRAVYADSGGEPIKATAAALKLLTEDHVAALLGPIGRQETSAVAAVARRFVVPQVTLSVLTDEQSARATDVVMRVRTSPVEVAWFLAREARARMGITRAAVLYPDTELGKEAATAFAEELQRQGADVARLVAYDPKTTDFKAVMKALMRAERPGKKVVADFDALFVPDAPDVVKRVLPQLELWHVPLRLAPLSGPVGKGKTTPVQLLGSMAWDSPLIIDKAEGLTDNATFAVIRADTSTPEGQAFATRFQARWSKAPLSFHAEVYDAARFLAGAVAKVDGADQDLRLALQDKLRQSRTEVGATGPLRVTMGMLDPRVQLMTIQGTTIRARLAEDDERTQRAAP